MSEQSTESSQVHWGSVDARPTSLHGNGAASFEQTSLDWTKVTCRLCQSLRCPHGYPTQSHCGLCAGVDG